MTFSDGGFETPSIRLKSIVSEAYGTYSPYDDRGARAQSSHREDAAESEEDLPEEDDPVPSRSHTRPRKKPEKSAAPPSKPRRSSAPAVEEDEEPEDVPSDLVGRRCLFHGGVAVTRCAKCKAVLCKECIRGSTRCPRCNSPLGGKSAKDVPEEEESEEQDDSMTVPDTPPPKKRPPRKRDDSKAEELSRL
jgi:hypothetical protein